MREQFKIRDDNEAMHALVRYMHYNVAPRVAFGDTFTLFRDEAEMITFCLIYVDSCGYWIECVRKVL